MCVYVWGMGISHLSGQISMFIVPYCALWNESIMSVGGENEPPTPLISNPRGNLQSLPTIWALEKSLTANFCEKCEWCMRHLRPPFTRFTPFSLKRRPGQSLFFQESPVLMNKDKDWWCQVWNETEILRKTTYYIIFNQFMFFYLFIYFKTKQKPFVNYVLL